MESVERLRGMRKSIVFEERIELLKEELYLQAEAQSGDDPMGDPIRASFALGFAEALEGRGVLEVMRYMLEIRDNLGSSDTANLCLRAFQKQLLRLTEEGVVEYPRDTRFLLAEAWHAEIECMFRGEKGYDDGSLAYDLWSNNVSSNKAERYKGFKIVAGLFPERFEAPISILDLGCSRNQGLKKMAIDSSHPFLPVTAVREEKRGINNKKRIVTDHEGTELFADLLKREIPLGPSVGIDIWRFNDPQVEYWAKSCSFYPSELLDQEMLDAYEELEKSDPEQVSYKNADVTSLNRLEEVLEGYPKFDMVTISAMLYQLSGRERARVVQNALARVKDNGLIVIQEFATRVGREIPTRGFVDELKAGRVNLNFPDNWQTQPYLYRTSLIDPSCLDKGIQELIHWQSGRCIIAKFVGDVALRAGS